jgi:hypothetical protein
MLQKLTFCVILIIFFSSLLDASTQNTVRFKDITAVNVNSISVDIQFVLSSDHDVTITTEKQTIELLKIVSEKGILTIQQNGTSDFPPKLRITIPNTILLTIDVRENSHIFIPEMISPVKVTGHDYSEVTIKACKGLSVTLTDRAKVQIVKMTGDMVSTQGNKSEFAIKEGQIGTSIMTVTDQSKSSIGATIDSLKLETKGASIVKLKNIAKALSWASRGNEQVAIHTISGAADVKVNNDSKLFIEDAKLDVLYAAVASTGKIKIQGTVKNAALSARGAGEIVVDKVTGKILRKSQIHKGTIRILNP